MIACPSCGGPVTSKEAHRAVMLDRNGKVSRVVYICPIDLEALR